jgi:hypothetical protein
MKRIHLFEFNDQPWYPDTFRRMQTDYLQFAATLTAGHTNLIPLFQRALQHAGTSEVLDLCSGGTGPWLRLHGQLEKAGTPVRVRLSDKYPNPGAIQKWGKTPRQGIEYLAEPVDALQVPSHLAGMRTLFQGFHHFPPEQARAILQQAVNQRAAIGIFEASLMPPLGLLLLLLAPVTTLFSFLVFTPLIKPRAWWRFLWTYLIPIVPAATVWDGIVSLLRVYSVPELQELVDSLEAQDYTWEIGNASTGTPVFAFTYLVGYPGKRETRKEGNR